MEAMLNARLLGEAGIFAVGWGLFFWAMHQLRHERARYQELTVHIITYFTKINMLKGSNPDANRFLNILQPRASNDEGAGPVTDSADDGTTRP